MQQDQKTPRTPEENFGQAVSIMRELKKMSQREFAAKLKERGMHVDASAVSRIEKGTRSVRLVEALEIASVLDTELSFLIRGSRSPSQELLDMRRYMNNSLHHAKEPIRDLALSFIEIRDFLYGNPDLLKDLKDDELGSPQTPNDYHSWVLKRLSRWEVSEDEYVEFSDAGAAEDFMEIMRTLIGVVCGPERPESEEISGVDQETT